MKPVHFMLLAIALGFSPDTHAAPDAAKKTVSPAVSGKHGANAAIGGAAASNHAVITGTGMHARSISNPHH